MLLRLDDLDEEEDDTMNRGQLLQMMPGYAQYLRKNDPRPKVILTGEKIPRLLSIINDPKTYKNGSAFCYNPRNFFCFYNSRNEIIAYYEVCFECGKFDARPEIKTRKKDPGFREAGLNRLSKFCRAAGISTGN